MREEGGPFRSRSLVLSLRWGGLVGCTCVRGEQVVSGGVEAALGVRPHSARARFIHI